jgi:site-specific DNA recombinase
VGLLAGYMRVSHVGSRDLERLRSPEEQTAEIEAWARAHRHRVELLPPELDAKGSDASRPVFRQAVEGVKAGLYSGVVVAYLSRAGRDLRLMLDLWDEVEAAGGVVYSARENIDASTASGKLQRNLLASIDQHQREERREGFERARKGAVERGIWQRRQTPRG